MAASRLHRYARQSLVPLLGFLALSLFVINFFTFLSHAFAPDRCTAGMREHERSVREMEARAIVLPRVRGHEVELRRIERQVQRMQADLQRAEGRLRGTEPARRRCKIREVRAVHGATAVVRVAPAPAVRAEVLARREAGARPSVTRVLVLQ